MSKRLPLLIIVAAVVVMLPFGAAAQEENAKGGPRMVLPEKILDFGVVPKGEVIAANFKVLNEGTAPLEIKTVRPTCGCTIADFPESIAAGSEGVIKARLDTMDFTGPINKALLLMTDDPETPSVSLVIKAMVQPFLEILPRAMIRINAIQTEEATEKVYLVANENVTKSYKVTKVESAVPFVKASFRLLEKSEAVDERQGKQYEITVTLTDDVPPGPLNAKVTIHTDHPKAPKVPFKVIGVVRALLNVTPMSLQFGPVDAAIKPGRNIIVVNNRPKGMVEVTAAEIDDPAFEAEIQTLEQGKRYQVAVTIKADATPGLRSATMRLTTTDTEFPELTVPVRASIR